MDPKAALRSQSSLLGRKPQQQQSSVAMPHHHQLCSSPINNNMPASPTPTLTSHHKRLHQPLAPIEIRSSSIMRRSSHARMVTTASASSKRQARHRANGGISSPSNGLSPIPPTVSAEGHRSKATTAVYQRNYKLFDDDDVNAAAGELDFAAPRARPITYEPRFSPNPPQHKRLNRLQ